MTISVEKKRVLVNLLPNVLWHKMLELNAAISGYEQKIKKKG